jgi:hypothetical protein
VKEVQDGVFFARFLVAVGEVNRILFLYAKNLAFDGKLLDYTLRLCRHHNKKRECQKCGNFSHISKVLYVAFDKVTKSFANFSTIGSQLSTFFAIFGG